MDMVHRASSNRKWLIVGAVGLVLAVVITVAVAVPLAKRAAGTETNLERARRVLKQYPLIDG